MEVNAISVLGKSKEFIVAEVKISKHPDELSNACRQMAIRAKKFEHPDILRKIFRWIKEPCKPAEVT